MCGLIVGWVDWITGFRSPGFRSHWVRKQGRADRFGVLRFANTGLSFDLVRPLISTMVIPNKMPRCDFFGCSGL